MIKSRIKLRLKLALEVFLGLVFVVSVACFALIWRLEKGPMSFGRFVPQIEGVLNAINHEIQVKIDDAVLTWRGEDRSFHFMVIKANLLDREGRLIGHVPQIEIDLAALPLLRAKIVPSRIELIGPSAVLVRRADGGFQLGLARQEDGESIKRNQDGSLKEPEAGPLARLVSAMINAEKTGSPLADLKSIVIRDASMEFFDITSGSAWEAPRSIIVIARDKQGIAWRLNGDVRLGTDEVKLVLSGDYELETGAVTASAEFTDFNLAALAAKSSYFQQFAGLDFPIRGSARLNIGEDNNLENARFTLDIGKGELHLAELGSTPAIVDYGAFAGTYNGETNYFDIQRLHYAAGGNKATFRGNAKVTFQSGKALAISKAEIDLEGREIEVDVPGIFSTPIAFRSIDFAGTVDIDQTEVRFSKLEVTHDDSRFLFAGLVRQGETSPILELTGEVRNVPATDLDALWPLAVAPKARKWVTGNILDGTLTKGTLTVNAQDGALAERPIPDELVRFDFHAKDIDFTYVKGLPKIEGAEADLFLTGQTFGLTLHKGAVHKGVNSPLYLKPGGKLLISQLHNLDSFIEIDLKAHGDLQDGLMFIEHPPLKFASRFGLKPEAVSGKAHATIHLEIPRRKEKVNKGLVLESTYELSGVSLETGSSNMSLQNGELTLDVTRERLVGSGSVQIADVPANVVWTERFDPSLKSPSKYVVEANFNADNQIKLGWDTGGILTGDVPIKVAAIGKGADIRRIDVEADLTNANVDLEEFEIFKKPGGKAKGEMTLVMLEGGGLHFSSIRAEGDNLDVQGDVKISENGSLESAKFERLWIGDFVDISFDARRGKSNELVMSLGGNYLNADPFIKQGMAATRSRPTKPDEVIDQEDAVENADAVQESVGWAFEGDIKKLDMRGEVTLLNANFDVAHNGSRFTSLSAKGDFDGGGRLFTAMMSGGRDKRHIVLTSSDAGKFIEGLMGARQVEGGNLAIKMEVDDAKSGDEGAVVTSTDVTPETISSDDDPGRVRSSLPIDQAPTIGLMEMTDFRVVDMPVLARLLTVGSLEGLGDLLQGEGIRFDRLSAPFWVTSNREIVFDDASASGPAMGLTMYGSWDQSKAEADLNGTLVPSYTLNSVLGNVPVFGPMLVSREGEGVIGFTYGISGPTSGPTVFVNPLSGLAPGFLRRVFQPINQHEARSVPVDRLKSIEVPEEELTPG